MWTGFAIRARVRGSRASCSHRGSAITLRKSLPGPAPTSCRSARSFAKSRRFLRPDWSGVEEETVSRLKAIIRFDTTNPPGNELPLARYLERALSDEGIETTVLEPATNRAQLFGRIRGSGAKRPVMLLAHMDV